MNTAYLVATFSIVNGIPLFRELSIYSEGADTLTRDITGREARMDVLSVKGHSYSEAVADLIRTVDTIPLYAWCRPFLKRR